MFEVVSPDALLSYHIATVSVDAKTKSADEKEIRVHVNNDIGLGQSGVEELVFLSSRSIPAGPFRRHLLAACASPQLETRHHRTRISCCVSTRLGAIECSMTLV